MEPDATRNVEITEDFIDLERVIKSKSERLNRLLPGFIKSYLKRVIHQDEINKALYRNREKSGLDFVEAILKEFGAILNISGTENISNSNRLIIASNHPLGGLDGLALMHVAGKIRPDIVFPVNDLLMNLPQLRSLFIPINKHGSNAENAKIIDDTFASDRAILYFPAGLCSRKQPGGICDLEWKKSFITKARKHKRDIIPCHVDGRNSNWFYNLSRLRNMAGIKANIEMLYLVDEMYQQHDKTLNIIFGKPIPWQTFDKRHTDLDWAQLVKAHVYKLESAAEAEFVEKS
ncbi:MAG TPA: 1-acyl-sn-glycerol-3-phosphate acyltransferase [Bacteroidales bacterium]|jgi:1-acyl-sn-glycerol-3-phosphate acyltransferase|nr:1-acyl-sn-glycerol-3-phosphate acyltransferase [Bacteroidales bacterium]